MCTFISSQTSHVPATSNQPSCPLQCRAAPDFKVLSKNTITVI